MALDGEWLVVSADRGSQSQGAGVGSAWLYHRTDGLFRPVGRLVAEVDSGALHGSGTDVLATGADATVAVGAPGDHSPPSYGVGVVHVYNVQYSDGASSRSPACLVFDRVADLRRDPRHRDLRSPVLLSRPMASRRRTYRTAATSDRHELYELSVQSPDVEVTFIDRVCRRHSGKVATTLREDFCGTFALCGEWVRRRRTNRAVGVDLDRAVLDWGRRRAARRLSDDERSRISLRQANVMSVREAPVDVLCAFNFSYFIFKTRAELLRYFGRSFDAVKPGGLFLLDCYGGSESFSEMEEERNLDGFVYVWDQHRYNPITGEVVNHIHFRFPDGSEMARAFTYEWRLWTLPELREALVEAGFRKVTVYWEGTTAKGEGNGIFRPSMRGEACQGWIAYLVAEKGRR